MYPAHQMILSLFILVLHLPLTIITAFTDLIKCPVSNDIDLPFCPDFADSSLKFYLDLADLCGLPNANDELESLGDRQCTRCICAHYASIPDFSKTSSSLRARLSEDAQNNVTIRGGKFLDWVQKDHLAEMRESFRYIWGRKIAIWFEQNRAFLAYMVRDTWSALQKIFLHYIVISVIFNPIIARLINVIFGPNARINAFAANAWV